MELTGSARPGWNLRSMALHLGVTFFMAWALWLVALAPAPEDMSTGRLWMFAALSILSAVVLWVVAPPRPSALPPESLATA